MVYWLVYNTFLDDYLRDDYGDMMMFSSSNIGRSYAIEEWGPEVEGHLRYKKAAVYE